MQKFELNQSIKKSTLNPSEKLVLLEILSFIENNKEFYATNAHIAETFNFTERNVKAIISKLSKLGIIESEVKRKKHTTGDCSWYNKRYITINFDKLSEFLNVQIQPKQAQINPEIKSFETINVVEEIQSEIKAIEVIPTDEPIEVITDDSDEFDYDDEQQEAWFNQMAGITSQPIVKEIKPIVKEIKPNSTLTAVRPTHTIEDEKIVAKKLKFKEDFDKGMKYNAGTMIPSDFHYITKNYFRDTDPIIVLNTINKIDKNSFDEFWDRLQQLKLETIK